ncbi:MAG: DUF5615 family PIN-like protein [Thermoanaerobaculia bacterium]
MRLRAFRFLADENIHPEVVRFLREDRLDVNDVKEGPLLGEDDLTILRKAYEEERVVLTHDSDFGQLAVAKLEPVVGIIYLRPGHIDPAFTVETLRTALDEVPEVSVPFILVAERVGQQVKIRIRRL